MIRCFLMSCVGALCAWPLIASGAAAEVETDKPGPILAEDHRALTLTISESEVTDARRWRETWALLEKAVERGAEVIVFKIHVPESGTLVALPKAEQLARLGDGVKTVAWIDSAAVGGGALLALACDEIWMVPGSRIGAAPPDPIFSSEASEVTQKTEQAQAMARVKATARSLCKLKGHPVDLVAGMIDANLIVKNGKDTLAGKNELLLLDEDQATQAQGTEGPLADGILGDVGALVEALDLKTPLVALTETLLESPEPEPEGTTTADTQGKSTEGSKAKNRTRGDFTGKVVRITVGEDDLISPARFEFMTRTLDRCTEEGAEAVIFDLDTPGGLAWDTTNLMMRDLQKLVPPSYAFINPRALSAGAMIAIATDSIYIAPAGSAGAATPIYGGGGEMGEAERAKMNSAIMGMARTVAKQKGHDWRVIECMIDKDRELIVNGEVLCAEGEILTLDAEQAVMDVDGKPLFAKDIVTSIDEIRKAEGLKGEVVTAEPTSFESFAIWVTKYASILILIGLAAGYMEMQAPGFGLPGIVSILAFGTFFFGHYVAGSLVGQETAFMVGLFVLGSILLLLEIFLVPGMFVPGIVGFFCIMVALVYTMSGWEIPNEVTPEVAENMETQWGGWFSLATYAVGLRNFALGLVGAAVLIAMMIRFIPEMAPFKRLVLAAEAGGTASETPALSAAQRAHVGDLGVTRSALRPSGTIELDGKLLEAAVEGDYLQSGVDVRVREVSGSRVVVEAVT